jgi:hypothetical protein
MRLVESDLADAFESSAYNTLIDRVNEVKLHLSESITAGVMTSPEEVNTECTTAIEYILSKTDANLPQRIKEKARQHFEETVRNPLVRKCKEMATDKSGNVKKPTPSGSGSSSTSSQGPHKLPPGPPPPVNTNPYAPPPPRHLPYRPAVSPINTYTVPSPTGYQFAPPTSPPPPQSSGQPMYSAKDPRLCIRPGCNQLKAPGRSFCTLNCEKIQQQQMPAAQRKR